MPENLFSKSIEQLAEYVSEGGDTRAQKSESVLIAKSVLELKNAMVEIKKILDAVTAQAKESGDAAGKLATALNRISIAGVMIALIVGFATVWISKDQLHENHLKDSSDIVLNFDTQLNQPTYSAISDKLDSADPSTKILNRTGAPGFSKGQVENYLGVFEEMGNFYREGIVECSMINADFGYQIQKTWENKDIQSLIKRDQEVDPSLWSNFSVLVKQFTQKNPCN
ncbi:MAG: hypothetical protein RLZZ347_206 [Candidatus Parcubacteria bacterium]|jgi:hypothetical protein